MNVGNLAVSCDPCIQANKRNKISLCFLPLSSHQKWLRADLNRGSVVFCFFNQDSLTPGAKPPLELVHSEVQLSTGIQAAHTWYSVLMPCFSWMFRAYGASVNSSLSRTSWPSLLVCSSSLVQEEFIVNNFCVQNRKHLLTRVSTGFECVTAERNNTLSSAGFTVLDTALFTVH